VIPDTFNEDISTLSREDIQRQLATIRKAEALQASILMVGGGEAATDVGGRVGGCVGGVLVGHPAQGQGGHE
jgi:hypothetical protein